MNLSSLIALLPTLRLRPDGFHWTDGHLGGPYRSSAAAFTDYLTDQEKRLTPSQLGVWRVVHDAARDHWKRYHGNERDVLGALMVLMAGVQKGSSPAVLCRLACGDQWRAWLADIAA